MHLILNHEAALNYILGGNATVTVQNENSGNRFTFKIEKSKTANFELYFVSVLNGPDNTNSYLYIGSIINGRFNTTKKSKVTVDAPSFKAFEYILFHLKQGTLSDIFKFYHHGHCSKCGRKLTVPESILTGMGPHCSSMISKARKNKPELFS